MAKNLTPFFATDNDLAKLFEKILAKRNLKFILCGLFDEPIIHSKKTDSQFNPFSNYLVADYDLVIKVRSVPQKKGGKKFAIDQLENPKTVGLHLGGLIENHRLVAGQIGTATEDKTSLEIYKLLAKEIRKEFEKIKSYYVGKEASCLLDEGTRLTATKKSPQEYDLFRD
ncbi:MAG: hypothetical protein AB1454_14670 [Candidatus Auribacterota bacterium]